MSQPHVLFFMCDQMQYQRQGKIDSVAHTPNLDQLAEDGTFFTHFHAANGQCVPSRVLYHLSQDPDELHNLIGDSDAEPTRVKLEKMVDKWWDETGGKDAAYYESEAFKTRGGTIEEIQARGVF